MIQHDFDTKTTSQNVILSLITFTLLFRFAAICNSIISFVTASEICSIAMIFDYLDFDISMNHVTCESIRIMTSMFTISLSNLKFSKTIISKSYIGQSTVLGIVSLVYISSLFVQTCKIYEITHSSPYYWFIIRKYAK